jgi:hypothetical protein
MNVSQSFFESVALLVLTASITGFLIPFILKRIDDRKLKEQQIVDERKLREQKEFEAELARQAKIIESQVQLLENLSSLLWEFQLSAIEVSYYDPVDQSDLYVKAVNKYQEKTGELLSKIRSEISKALRLTTPETYQELKDLYYDQLLVLDVKLNRLIKAQKVGETPLRDWHEFNRFAVYDLAEIVDNALNHLAKELRLKGSTAKQEPTQRDNGENY